MHSKKRYPPPLRIRVFYRETRNTELFCRSGGVVETTANIEPGEAQAMAHGYIEQWNQDHPDNTRELDKVRYYNGRGWSKPPAAKKQSGAAK